MTTRFFLPVLFVLPFLAACASGEDAPIRHCPQVAVLRDLERVEDHGRDAIEPETLVAVAAMRQIEGACEYSDEGVDVSFDLHLAAEKGPRLGGDKTSFPYFVTVIGPDDAIRQKELMTARFTFPSGGKRTQLSEALHVFIPLKDDKEDASTYRVLMGFQLSEEQLKAARGEGAGDVK